MFIHISRRYKKNTSNILSAITLSQCLRQTGICIKCNFSAINYISIMPEYYQYIHEINWKVNVAGKLLVETHDQKKSTLSLLMKYVFNHSYKPIYHGAIASMAPENWVNPYSKSKILKWSWSRKINSEKNRRSFWVW